MGCHQMWCDKSGFQESSNPSTGKVQWIGSVNRFSE